MISNLIYQCTVHKTKNSSCKLRYIYLFPDCLVINKFPDPERVDKQIQLFNLDYMLEWRYSSSANSLSSLRIHKSGMIHYYKDVGNTLNGLKPLLDGKLPYLNFDSAFTVLETIKDSKTCQISKCRNIFTKELVVAKVLYCHQYQKSDLYVFPNINQQLSIHNEVLLSQKLAMKPHKSLNQLKEIYIEEHSIILIIDYCEGGTLYHYLDKHDFKLPSKVIRRIMKQLLRGLEHMHRIGIMHRDIKMDNIMLSKDNDPNSIKIIDFGFSTFVTDRPYLIDKCGTPGYIAPEVFSNEDYDERCDLYSLGAVFHILLAGEKLYSHRLSKKALIEQNQRNQFELSKRINDKVAYNLIEQMTSPKNMRPFVVECLAHQYFDKECQESTESNLAIRMKSMTLPIFKNSFKCTAL